MTESTQILGHTQPHLQLPPHICLPCHRMHTCHAPCTASPLPLSLRDSDRCLRSNTPRPACQGPRNSFQLQWKLPTPGPATQLHLSGPQLSLQGPAKVFSAPGCLQGNP